MFVFYGEPYYKEDGKLFRNSKFLKYFAASKVSFFGLEIYDYDEQESIIDEMCRDFTLDDYDLENIKSPDEFSISDYEGQLYGLDVEYSSTGAGFGGFQELLWKEAEYAYNNGEMYEFTFRGKDADLLGFED